VYNSGYKGEIMKFNKRNSVHVDLTLYCHLSKPHEICEVTEWTNGEGWDIAIGNRNFMLTYGELQALQVLCNVQHPKE
jgi:hypothetical protein